MAMRDKAALRRSIRAAFPGAEQRACESAALCRHVMDWPIYQAARIIGGYVPLKHEADITPVLADILTSGRMLALPRVEAEGMMTFRRIRSMDELVPGAFGVLEPAQDAPIIPAEDIELLLVPLEAIDRRGMRLGKGGGYYDRCLSGARMTTLGIVLSWQWTENMPADAWDCPLSAAADQDGIHLFSHE